MQLHPRAPAPPQARLSVGVTGHRAEHAAYAGNVARIEATLRTVLNLVETARAAAKPPYGAPTMAPSRLQDFIRAVRDVFERAAMAGETAVLLTGPQVRPYVRSIIERFRGQTTVMSQNEVHPRARLRTIGTV